MTTPSCIFFDRDGIVNKSPSEEEYYVLSIERFFIQRGFIESLKILKEKQIPAVIVTNQKCIHRGLVSEKVIQGIHDHLRSELAKKGLSLLDIYMCPFGDGHPNRKPNPGMLLDASADHGIDLSTSWMIGDTARDMEAGRAAGVAKNIQVCHHAPSPAADEHLPSMEALPAYLLRHL